MDLLTWEKIEYSQFSMFLLRPLSSPPWLLGWPKLGWARRWDVMITLPFSSAWPLEEGILHKAFSIRLNGIKYFILGKVKDHQESMDHNNPWGCSGCFLGKMEQALCTTSLPDKSYSSSFHRGAWKHNHTMEVILEILVFYGNGVHYYH